MDRVMNFIMLLFFECWNLMCDMAPYLLLGFAISGFLSVTFRSDSIHKKLGRPGLWSNIRASLFGVPLPLCSCGVIPVSATLRSFGASKGSIVSFLVSTPQTGVDSILVTWTMLSPVMAIFRPFAAFLSGVLSGVLVERLDPEDHRHVYPEISDGNSGMGGRLYRALRYGFFELPKDIAKPLFKGLFIAALISVIVPNDFFGSYIGSITGLFLALGIGVPIYVCATASVPIAISLIGIGFSPGAAFVFLMSGPATNAASISTLWNVIGKKSTIIYIIAISVSSIFFGFILDFTYGGYIKEYVSSLDINTEHNHSIGMIDNIYGIALLLLSLVAIFSSRLPNNGKPLPVPNDQLKVSGMTCGHCKDSVIKIVMACEGVLAVHVDLESGLVDISGAGYSIEQISAQISGLGFSVG